MNEKPLPKWFENFIFALIFIALTLGGIGHILIMPELDKAREKDPWIIIIE